MKLSLFTFVLAILCTGCTKKISVPDSLKLKRGSIYSDIFYNASHCETKGVVNTTDKKYVLDFSDTSEIKKIVIPKGTKITFKIDISIDTLRGNSKHFFVKPSVKDFDISFSKPIPIKLQLKKLKKPIAVKVSRLSLSQIKKEKIDVSYKILIGKSISLLLSNVIIKQDSEFEKMNNDKKYPIPDIKIDYLNIHFRPNSKFKLKKNLFVLDEKSSLSMNGFVISQKSETSGKININFKLGKLSTITSEDLIVGINEGNLNFNGNFTHSEKIFEIILNNNKNQIQLSDGIITSTKAKVGNDDKFESKIEKLSINFPKFRFSESLVSEQNTISGNFVVGGVLTSLNFGSKESWIESRNFTFSDINISYDQPKEDSIRITSNKNINLGVENFIIEKEKESRITCSGFTLQISPFDIKKWGDMTMGLDSSTTISSKRLKIENEKSIIDFEQGVTLKIITQEKIQLIKDKGKYKLDNYKMDVIGNIDKLTLYDKAKNNSIFLSNIKSNFRLDENNNLKGEVSLISENAKINDIAVSSLLGKIKVSIDKMKIESSKTSLKVTIPEMIISINKDEFLAELKQLIPADKEFPKIDIPGRDLARVFSLGTVRDFRLGAKANEINIGSLNFNNNRAYFNIAGQIRVDLEAEVLSMKTDMCYTRVFGVRVGYPCAYTYHKWTSPASVSLTAKVNGSAVFSLSSTSKPLSEINIVYTTNCDHIDIRDFPGWVENSGEIEQLFCKLAEKEGKLIKLDKIKKENKELLSKMIVEKINLNTEANTIIVKTSLTLGL